MHVYSRGEHGEWVVLPFGPGEEVVFPCLGIRVSIAHLYRAVRLREEAAADSGA